MIVAGGFHRGVLTTVEILNIENHQWSTAAYLPEPMQYHSAAICGDQLYMLGGACGYLLTKSVYTCSVSTLLRIQAEPHAQKSLLGTLKHTLSLSNNSSSSGDGGVWSEVADLPVIDSTCVTFCGQLLAIGGKDSDSKPTTAVYMYNPSTNSWNVISHITTARTRRRPFAAVLPDNQLMVVGGEARINNRWTYLDLVEFGDLC